MSAFLASLRAPSSWPILLFVPNLIGYVRVAAALAAFASLGGSSTASAFRFASLYALSYLLDAVDGPAARALKQTTAFGALLDMVTDRAATAGLLAVLAGAGGAGAGVGVGGGVAPHVWLWLMCLDIVSHWMQMYR